MGITTTFRSSLRWFRALLGRTDKLGVVPSLVPRSTLMVSQYLPAYSPRRVQRLLLPGVMPVDLAIPQESVRRCFTVQVVDHTQESSSATTTTTSGPSKVTPTLVDPLKATASTSNNDFAETLTSTPTGTLTTPPKVLYQSLLNQILLSPPVQ